MGECYIVGAGDFTPRDFSPQPGDFIIAADGGLRPLLALGRKPDWVIGDLDSFGQEVPADLPLKRLPVEKDDTDTAAALAAGFERGFRRFRLYGCGGGRVDHLLANFQIMAKFSKAGASVRLTDTAYDAYALTDGTLLLPSRPRGTLVSVFCHGNQAEGVTLRGLKYPLNGYTLTCDVPLGVSNEHTDEAARITVARGTLLIVQYLPVE